MISDTLTNPSQVLPIYQPIVFVIVFLVCAPLFHFCFPRCREDGTSRMIRKLAVGLAILLLCTAAAGSKRLHDHWASRYYPLEIGWTITSLSEAKRAELLKIVDEAAGPYRGKLMSSIDDNDLTTRFIITNGIFYKAHQNAIVLRFRSRAPEEFRPLFNQTRLQTQVWWDYQVRMQRPTILIVLATVLAAVIAAWCGLPLGLIPILAGGLFAGVLALLPAFPTPPEIEARVMSVPLDPIQPLLPDYSEPTIAIQSVLDAAFILLPLHPLDARPAGSGCDGSEARAALSELCVIYYQPVLQFTRCWCGDADRAQDLEHGFFEDLLGRESIGAADPVKGR